MIKPIIINEKKVPVSDIDTFHGQLAVEGIHVNRFHTKMLLSRGINTPEAAKVFLEPELSTMYNPFLLKGMEEATVIIKEMIQNGELITIYGDYDVDGVTSTTILYRMLSKCGAKVEYYIPDRIEEGYGINTNALEKLYNNGSKLVISVDTGITAVEQVAFANELGLKMIITDHHECQEVIPDALAVINPKQEDCSYPFDMLAGVGVTYKLIQGLEKVFNIDSEFVLDLLEIVAVGTVSDLVPLVDENRTFVYQAFKRMKKIKNIGLDALVKVSGIDTDRITAGSIGFQIGPRLNAAGRLGDAKRGVKLFLCEDNEEALKMAEALNEENQRRRKMEEEILLKADEIVSKTIDVRNTKVLVVAHEGWHHGVIGIVASRICEKYYRPTILLAVEDGIASGSARSVDGFSIFDALSSTKDLLDKFGGHEMAAGMSFDATKIGELSDNLNKYAREHMDDQTLIPKVKVESRLKPSEINVEFIDELSVFEPYGMGNEEPRFLINGTIDSMTLMGKDRNHFKMALTDGDKKVDHIGFYNGDYINELTKNMETNVIGTFNVNEWKGYRKPQVFIKSVTYGDETETFMEDLKSTVCDFSQIGFENVDSMTDNEISLDRSFCAGIYKSLKKMDLKKDWLIFLPKLHELAEESLEKQRFTMSKYKTDSQKVLAALMVFCQLELIKMTFDGGEVITFEMNSSKKVELQKSTLYNSMCS